MKKKILYITALTALLLTSGNDAQAAQGTATASISSPVGVSVLSDLAFGHIVPATGGTVTIDPDTAVRSLTGGVILVNSVHHPALFSVIGTPNKPYHVHILSSTITISNPQGATMQALLSDSSILNGSKNYKFDAAGNATFNIGGTLTVAANQAKGEYSGTFTVDVSYN